MLFSFSERLKQTYRFCTNFLPKATRQAECSLSTAILDTLLQVIELLGHFDTD